MEIKEIHEAIKKAETQPRKSNIERNGYYRDPTISANLRKVGTRVGALTDNVRHRDSDFNQVCGKCFKHYLIIEGSADPDKASYYIRSMAEDLKHTAWAVKMIHAPRDLAGTETVDVTVWKNGRGNAIRIKNMTWQQVYVEFEKIQLEHEKSRDCAKRAWFK